MMKERKNNINKLKLCLKAIICVYIGCSGPTSDSV